MPAFNNCLGDFLIERHLVSQEYQVESKTRLNLVEVAYSDIDYIAYHILHNRISCVTALRAIVLLCAEG